MLNAHNVLQRAAQGSGFGTANATATAKLQSVSSFALTPDLQTRSLNQLRGSLAPTYQTVLDHYMSNATFEVSDETFEDLNYWLDSLFSAATPGGTGPYTRAYAAPLTSEADPTFMTLQWGQTDEVWQMQDASVSTLTLSGSSNSGVQVGGSLIGGKVIAGTLASLSDRASLTRMTGCMAALAIDAWAGTMGATAIASSAFSWELTINANRQYRSYLGGCTPSAWNDQKWSGQLRLSLELNDTTDDYIIAILAAANTILERQIEISYTNASDDLLEIQFAGHAMSAPQLFQDRNGVMTYDLVFDGVYNSTFGNWLKINTTSGIDALV
jgi:hypothetical protein